MSEQHYLGCSQGIDYYFQFSTTRYSQGDKDDGSWSTLTVLLSFFSKLCIDQLESQRTIHKSVNFCFQNLLVVVG